VRNALLIFALGLIGAGCYAAIEVTTGASMTCYFDDVVLFSGDIGFHGIGLEGLGERLSGEWTLWQTPEDRNEKAHTRCVLAFGKISTEAEHADADAELQAPKMGYKN